MNNFNLTKNYKMASTSASTLVVLKLENVKFVQDAHILPSALHWRTRKFIQSLTPVPPRDGEWDAWKGVYAVRTLLC